MTTTMLARPEHTQAFRQRRAVNWLSLGMLYAFFYATRYNFAAAAPRMAVPLGWKNTELGVFEMMMPLVYGLAVVFNGPLADRVGGKKAFLFGAVGVTVMNVLFGLASFAVISPAVWSQGANAQVVTPAVLGFGLTSGTLLTLMAIVWGLNGYFQSFGALSIVKVNAQWFHVRERGTFAGVFGVLIRFGLLLAFQGVPLIFLFFPWQYAFWIPGLCVAVFFLVNLKWMQNSPKDAGLGEFDTGDDADPTDVAPTIPDILRKVFASRTMWIIAAGSMMVGFVRRSVVDAWWPKYFVDEFLEPRYRLIDPMHAKELAAQALGSYPPYIIATWGIALAGIAGGFAFGITSDRRFGGRRAPVIAFGFLGMAFLLGAVRGIGRAAPRAHRRGVLPGGAVLLRERRARHDRRRGVDGLRRPQGGGLRRGPVRRHAVSRGRVRRPGRRLHHGHVGMGTVALGADPLRAHRRPADDADLERRAEGKGGTLTPPGRCCAGLKPCAIVPP